METNSFYQIGKDHKVCEDYSICGVQPFPFAILSDGCSTGKNTDVGSRILVSITKKNIELFTPENYREFIETIVFQSKAIAKIMGVEKECLLATLTFIATIDNKTYVLMIGDGCFIYKENNEIKSISHEYKNNYPYYPIYIKSNIDETNKGLLVKKDINQEELPYSTIQLYEFENIEWIMASSDGIFSFTNGDELIDFENIKKEMSDIKSFKGEFIERKMKRVTKNFNKDGFYNSDDWSMTGIYLGE